MGKHAIGGMRSMMVPNRKADIAQFEQDFFQAMQKYRTRTEETEPDNSSFFAHEFRRLAKEYEKVGKNADALQAQLEKTRKGASQRVESRKQTAVRNQLKDIHSKRITFLPLQVWG